MDPPKRKELGQHFLREPRIARRIIDAAELQPGERVLEIGPGDGVLTRPMCELLGSGGADGEVVAVEADHRFADLLESDKPDNLTIVRGDALRAGLATLGHFDAVVANLPYQISGPITATLLAMAERPGWKRAVLMYQKEFAERLLAGPGSKKYGRLSVQTHRYCDVRKIRDVPPGCFDPPPKVDSTVIRLDPRPAPFTVADETVWDLVLAGTFQQRRKQLRNTVPTAVGVEGIDKDRCLGALADLGMEKARPEQLSPADFAALVARLVA